MTSQLPFKFCSEKQNLAIDGVTASIYKSIDQVPKEWDQIVPAHQILLQRPYLEAMEATPPHGMQFAYLLFYKKDQAVGMAYCQIQHFHAEKSIRYDEGEKEPSFFVSLGRYIRGLVASRVEFNTLVCGNLLFTGEHGYYFDSNKVEGKDMILIVDAALKQLQKNWAKEGIPIAVLLYKEFYAQRLPDSGSLKQNNYNEFTIQPNMILDIPEHWGNFDDYLAALVSKYRVRYRRARKKRGDLQLKELSAEEIKSNLPRLNELYKEVASNSGFNVVNIHADYWYSIKHKLPERFRMYGYYRDDQLVAFYTTLVCGDEMEAHFLGFERSINHSCQLYLNILYDLIQLGIDGGSKRILFARTALEIKSSVGAVAHEMYCYLRHRNSFSNRFLQPILDYLRPDTGWEARKPFK